ncbi:hypothetical protein AGMMS50230_04440 [Spirochaetia bacterium]|nr:hypothetical protein AGMMS50230_04440 [Spirochaetia bacterium]
MIERLVPAKNGFTVYVEEIALHSRYNPAEEAERYIASLKLESNRSIILLEPGLFYLERAIQKAFPQMRIITLHCSAFFSPENPALGCQPGSLSWNPASPEDLEDFLERVSGEDGDTIRLIEWRPSINAYGKACVDLAARTVECIRRISANRVTVKNFGRRWLSNALRNMDLLGNAAEIQAGSAPVVICAAGPGLEDALDTISRWKESPAPPLIIAVSSAVPALVYRGIIPDLVNTTDGGGWALFHLVEDYRLMSGINKKQANPAADQTSGLPILAADQTSGLPILAAALTAALPSQAAGEPILILSDGSLWQEVLLQAFGLPFVRFPQRGTVSASALDLARFLSTGSIYLAGLDFSHRDIKTHASPYAFEKLLNRSASRFFPFYSRTFERSRTINTSGSHGIYAVWFKTRLETLSNEGAELFSLGPSALGIPPAGPLPGSGSGGIMPRFIYGNRRLPPGSGKKRARDLLLEALTNPLTARQIGKELGELLGSTKPEDTDTVRNELLDLYG